MKSSLYVLALCMSAGLTLPVLAQSGQGGAARQQQPNQSQMGQQPQMGQQQFNQQPGAQMGQQQRMGGINEQRIRQFFGDAQRSLQQATRSQDPLALRQYLSQFMADDAQITTISELYVGDRHVATSIAHSNEEGVVDALGHAANALQGRRLVSDYNVDIRVRDIQMLPGQQAARVTAVVQESGDFAGPVAQRLAERARERFGQMSQNPQQQWGFRGQEDQSGRSTDDDDNTQMQGRGMGGMGGMGSGQGRGGGTDGSGIHFQTRSTCQIDIGMEQGQMRIGNTVCRGITRLS